MAAEMGVTVSEARFGQGDRSPTTANFAIVILRAGSRPSVNENVKPKPTRLSATLSTLYHDVNFI